jgi:hypothetical protein
MIIHSPIISGSLEFAEGATFTLPDNGIYSGSFSGSIQVHQVKSHLVPDANEVYDLGSSTNRFRDLYLSNNTINFPSGSFGFGNDGFAFKDPFGDPAAFVAAEVKIADPVSGDIISLKIVDGQLETTATDSEGAPIDPPSSNLSGSFTGSFLGNVLSTNGVVSGSSQVVLGSTTDFSTFSGSLKTTDDALATVDAAQTVRLDQLATASGSYDSHIASTANPHSVTADQVSLGNVTNESKATMFSSPTFTGTVSGVTATHVGLGNVTDESKATMFSSPTFTGTVSGVTATHVGLGNVTDESKATMFSSPTFTGTVSGVTATHVGLGNVDNTSDANKPVSTAGQTALDLKANLASPTFTGTPLSTTPSSNDSSTKIATTAYVQGEITDLIGGAGAAFDTLLEISASIANGDSDVVALTTVVSGKLQKDQNLSDLTNTGTARTNLSLDNVTNESKATMFTSPTFTGTVSGVSATHVGLGNVTNESKATMFSSPTFTGTVSGVTKSHVGLGNVTNESKATMFSSPTFTGTVSGVTATHVGLGSVDNTADSAKPVSTAQQTALDAKLNIGGVGVVSGSSQVSHDSTTGFVANEHIDHSTVSVTAGNGLTGGGTIAATRTINVVGTADRISVSADAVDIASTYVGQSTITTLGTIATGTWNGSVIASAYLDADTAHLSGTQTFSGAKTFSSTTASTTKTTGAVIVTGGVGIGGALNVGGDVVAYASSDERLKDNIELISNPIEKVQSLKGVTWDWNSNADELQKTLPNVGVIAQDVEKILPQLVINRDNGFKGVDYAKLTGLLIEAIKDQQKQIEELKSKLG